MFFLSLLINDKSHSTHKQLLKFGTIYCGAEYKVTAGHFRPMLETSLELWKLAIEKRYSKYLNRIYTLREQASKLLSHCADSSATFMTPLWTFQLLQFLCKKYIN